MIYAKKNLINITKISFILCILFCVVIFFKGFKKGIEISGGAKIEFTKNQNINLIQKELKGVKIHNNTATYLTSKSSEKEIQDAKLIIEKYSDISSVKFLGSSVSEHIMKVMFTSVFVSLIGIFFYILIRFNMKFALSGVLTLVHDLIYIMYFISALSIEVNIVTFSAILTLLGYSINDTIVIFDKIRSNLNLKNNIDFIIESSLKSVTKRSIMTSCATMVSAFGILFFQDISIKMFGVIVVFGVIIGACSSIFISTGLLFILKLSKPQHKQPSLNYMHYAS